MDGIIDSNKSEHHPVAKPNLNNNLKNFLQKEVWSCMKQVPYTSNMSFSKTYQPNAVTCNVEKSKFDVTSEEIEDVVDDCYEDQDDYDAVHYDFIDGMKEIRSTGEKEVLDVPKWSKNIIVKIMSPSNSNIIVKSADGGKMFINGKLEGYHSVPGSVAWLTSIHKCGQTLQIPGPVTKPIKIFINAIEPVTVKYWLGRKSSFHMDHTHSLKNFHLPISKKISQEISQKGNKLKKHPKCLKRLTRTPHFKSSIKRSLRRQGYMHNEKLPDIESTKDFNENLKSMKNFRFLNRKLNHGRQAKVTLMQLEKEFEQNHSNVEKSQECYPDENRGFDNRRYEKRHGRAKNRNKLKIIEPLRYLENPCMKETFKYNLYRNMPYNSVGNCFRKVSPDNGLAIRDSWHKICEETNEFTERSANEYEHGQDRLKNVRTLIKKISEYKTQNERATLSPSTGPVGAEPLDPTLVNAKISTHIPQVDKGCYLETSLQNDFLFPCMKRLGGEEFNPTARIKQERRNFYNLVNTILNYFKSQDCHSSELLKDIGENCEESDNWLLSEKPDDYKLKKVDNFSQYSPRQRVYPPNLSPETFFQGNSLKTRYINDANIDCNGDLPKFKKYFDNALTTPTSSELKDELGKDEDDLDDQDVGDPVNYDDSSEISTSASTAIIIESTKSICCI